MERAAGALRERDDVDRVQKAIDDPDTFTVVQIVPVLRIS